MSIVNISSENKITGNDSDFSVKLKKTMMRAIGVQILNISIPLSYYNINSDNNVLHYYYNGVDNLTIPPGNYTADDLAYTLTNLFIADNSGTDYRMTREQWEYHNESKSNSIDIGKGSGITTAQFRNDGTIEEFVTASNGRFLTNNNGDVDNIEINELLACQMPQVGVIYDKIKEQFVFISQGSACSIYGTHPTAGTDIRLLKILGFNHTLTDTPTYGEGVAQGTTDYTNNVINSYVLTSNFTPEVSGPSLIYLRLGGDMLLDQQNTETDNNDRIPIPLDQPHGGVVHYENADKADLIPFSVPCDVQYIKIRLEDGYTNGTIGGDEQNLRGHHCVMRLKFYFAHQGGGPRERR